jgi:DNA topoisomerase-3
VCAPDTALVLAFRDPTPAEQRAFERISESLHERNGQSTGKLHRDLFGEALERKAFERLLAALVRAGNLREEPDEFESDGRTVSFRRAWLVGDPDPAALARAKIAVEPEIQKAPSRRKPRERSETKKRAAGSARGAAPASLVDALKAWRLAEAHRRRVPAFRILTDRVLLAIAAERPTDDAALLEVHGMGPRLLEKYGAKLLEIVKTAGARA